MIGVLMTALALGCSLLALAVAVTALLKVNKLEQGTKVATRDIRVALQQLRSADK